MEKKGFTLVELLATIVIIGVLSSIAGFAIFSMVESSRQQLLDDQIKSLGDSAINYTTLKRYFFDACPSGFDPANPITSQKNKCYREVTVQNILDAELFDNKNDLCNDDATGPIIVYKVKLGNGVELKSYVPEGMCTYEREE